MKITILYSGGLDSLIMRRWAAVHHPDAEVNYVYFNIGHKYAHKEMAVLPKDVEVHDMTWFSAQEYSKEGTQSGGIFIPGRNLLFATIAACKYLPDEIWLGALLGETHEKSTDKNWKFAGDTSDLFSYVLNPFLNNGKTKVVFPLAEAGMGKFEATKWAFDQGMKDEILQSSSCMDDEAGACGKCVVCVRRWGIFKQLGLEEQYRCDPVSDPQSRKMMKEMVESQIDIDAGVKKEKDVHYDHFRRREIVPALMLHFKSASLHEVLRQLGD
jgi:7-cyano-7-deazaguanine synthase in queuosine biosynthesis